MARAGRVAMPWGKYKGVRVRHLPDDYLSWLYELKLGEDFAWLHKSVMAEMQKRGFKTPALVLELAQQQQRVQPSGRKLCLDE